MQNQFEINLNHSQIIQTPMSSFTLQEYRIQRQYRQNKRKEYLKRFELLKQKIPINSFVSQQTQKSQSPYDKSSSRAEFKPSTSQASRPPVREPQPYPQSQQMSKLVQQNDALKKELESLQADERKKLTEFKQQISNIKQKYLSEIKGISAHSQKNKTQTEQKMKKILDQMAAGLKKNEQIKKVNQEMRKQIAQGDSSIGLYTTQIKNEYSKKLNEFEKIFNSSNEKIQEMENEFNQDEFIQNALQNQELLKTIQENASKSDQSAKLLEDYKQLLDGKNQILKQINSNIQMKQSELAKMTDLEGKMKVIFEKMNDEKKVYVTENQKMTKELMEIKDLIMGLLNQAEEAPNA